MSLLLSKSLLTRANEFLKHSWFSLSLHLTRRGCVANICSGWIALKVLKPNLQSVFHYCPLSGLGTQFHKLHMWKCSHSRDINAFYVQSNLKCPCDREINNSYFSLDFKYMLTKH